jgi:hypothetical protein
MDTLDSLVDDVRSIGLGGLLDASLRVEDVM